MSRNLQIPQIDKDLGRELSQLANVELKSCRLGLEPEAAASFDELIAHGVTELLTIGATDDDIVQAKENLQALVQQIAAEEKGTQEMPLGSIQITADALQSALAKLCPVFPFC